MQMIHDHGLQFPINDQWYSEYEHLYKPFFNGNLNLLDFFRPHNEHVIAIQKAMHLGLLIATGEWSPMAQMFLNALLFSVLLFVAALLAGLYLAPVPSAVLQAAILTCGLMPGPAENFLFGFQTGWYVYYFLSGFMLFCLSKSQKFDLWWMVAWGFAVLSCLCLASGIGNLCLCFAAPALRKWAMQTPMKHILLRSTPYLALCMPAFLLFLKIAFDGRVTNQVSGGAIISNLVSVFSYPGTLFPILYLPTLFGFWLLLAKPPALALQQLFFSFLFAIWSFLHGLLIAAGRGSFSGRHEELLLLGVISNILFVLFVLKKSHSTSFCWLRKFIVLWLACILAGLAFRGVETRSRPQDCADFMLPRYEILKDSFVFNDPLILTSRSWETGLPAGLFASRPRLWDEPTVQKIAPSFFPSGIRPTPTPDTDLLMESTQMFPTAFPFLTWAEVRGAGNGIRSEQFTVSSLSQPYVKIVFAGRWDDSTTGLYVGGQKMGLKMPFSQPEGWRAVFLPVSDGSVEFTVKISGGRDWLLLQQPIPVSRLQVAMEFVGRQAWRIWAFFLGLSIFLLVLKGFMASPFPGTLNKEI